MGIVRSLPILALVQILLKIIILVHLSKHQIIDPNDITPYATIILYILTKKEFLQINEFLQIKILNAGNICKIILYHNKMYYLYILF